MAEFLTNTAATVLMSFLSLLSAYVIMYAKKAKAKTEKEIEKIENQKQRELFETAVKTVDKLSEKTVSALEQTCAGEVRKLVKEGTIDRKYLDDIGKDAVTSVYRQLKPEYEKALEKGVNDVVKYITDSVEEKVLALKKAE